MDNATKVVRAIWLILFLGVLYYFYTTLARLPDHFAVHFDINGKPNGWGEKNNFFYFFGGMVLVTNAIIFAIYQLRHIVKFKMYKNFESPRDGSPEQIRNEVITRSSLILALAGIFINYVFAICVQVIGQAAITMPITVPPDLLLGSIFAVTTVFLIYSLVIARPKLK